MVRNNWKCQLGRLPSLIHRRYLLDPSIRYDLCTSGSLHSFPSLPTLPLSTFYASQSTSYSQDKHDDTHVGIRSTARLFGQHSRLIISLFSVAMIDLLAYTGVKNDQAAPYYTGVTTAAGQLARIAWSVE